VGFFFVVGGGGGFFWPEGVFSLFEGFFFFLCSRFAVFFFFVFRPFFLAARLWRQRGGSLTKSYPPHIVQVNLEVPVVYHPPSLGKSPGVF